MAILWATARVARPPPLAVLDAVIGCIEEEARGCACRGGGGVAQSGDEIGVALAGADRLFFPALSLLPGQTPIQAAKWSTAGKAERSMPTSAMTVTAVTQSMPARVSKRSIYLR